MSQGSWMGQGLLCVLVKCEAPQGAVSEVPLEPVRSRLLVDLRLRGRSPCGVCGFKATLLLTSLAGIPTVPVPVMQLHAGVEGPDQAPGRESHHFPHP